MDLLYLVAVLWRRKWIIILLSVLSVVVAFFLTKNLPVRYRSAAQLSTGFTTKEGILVTDDRINVREIDLQFNNLMSLMHSGNVFNLVAYRLIIHDLDPDNTPFRNLNDPLKSQLTSKESELITRIFKDQLDKLSPLTISEKNADLQFRVVRSFGYTYPWIKNSINIRRLPNTDFIQIEFISENPYLSAFAANAYCEEFLRYYNYSKTEVSGESVNYYEALVTKKKEELDEKSEALKRFKENNQFLNIDMQGQSNLTELSSLEKQKSDLESKIYGLDLKLQDLRSSLSNQSDGSVSNEGNYQKIVNLRQMIATLNQRYINSGSTDTNLSDSIRLLRDQLNFELSKVNTTPGNRPPAVSDNDIQAQIQEATIDRSVAQTKLTQVNNQIRSLRGNLSTYASKEAAMKDLERDVEVASDDYLNAVNKYNEAKNTQIAITSSLRQTVHAAPAASPESTKRLIIIAFSGFATFALCVFLIIAMEVFDTSLKTPDQFQRLVDMPLAGSLIKVDVKKLNYGRIFSEKQPDPELETFKHFLRKIRYEIENSDAKVIMVTSAKCQEGKSFIIFALAFVMSMIKKRVLIIDTNFKNNLLTKWLSNPQKKVKLLDSSKGYELKLYEEVPGNGQGGEEAREDADLITNTKYKNIFLIGNGGGDDSPDEIFNGRDFSGLVESLKLKFDYILLEGPALNEFSDAKELVQYVEKVIPVFSAESTIKQLDQQTIAYLKSLNSRLGAAILNKVDIKNLKI